MRGLKNKRVNIVYTYIIQKTKIFFKKKIRKKFINQKVKKQGNARLYSERIVWIDRIIKRDARKNETKKQKM